jgi:hypothetical protein
MIREKLLGISPAETSMARRGFHLGDDAVRRRLEHIGATFVHGYNAAISAGGPSGLPGPLAAVEYEFRGFAFEGAAMGLTILDALTPWHRWRLNEFLAGQGAPHIYLAYVGAGWAVARLGLGINRFLARLDPVLCWLVIDGYGFHEGYFHSQRCLGELEIPRSIKGYARNAFDQGLGRSLWFVTCAEPDRVAAMIARFPEARRGDLWGGVGLAAAYAGGARPEALEWLLALSGSHRLALAQGAAFGAKARDLAGNRAECTELACRVFCDEPAGVAAKITDAALAAVRNANSIHSSIDEVLAVPAYEQWRQGIQLQFQQEAVTI